MQTELREHLVSTGIRKAIDDSPKKCSKRAAHPTRFRPSINPRQSTADAPERMGVQGIAKLGRIVTAGMERMASADAPCAFGHTAYWTVLFDCLDHVLGTCRSETALAA